MKFLLMICFSTLLFPASQAMAHDGHGTTAGHTLLHYTSEPLHLVGIVTAVLGVALLAVALWRLRRRQR